MTNEEAARILDPDTRWLALSEYEYYAGFNGGKAMIKADEDAITLALSALRRKNGMTGNEYQALAERTMNKKLKPFHQEAHALHLMASEVGEIHGIYQKSYQGHQIDNVALKKELGDLLWGIAEFCTANGFEMDKIMEMNIEKLRKRYPEGFSEDRSLNREE